MREGRWGGGASRLPHWVAGEPLRIHCRGAESEGQTDRQTEMLVDTSKLCWTLTCVNVEWSSALRESRETKASVEKST